MDDQDEPRTSDAADGAGPSARERQRQRQAAGAIAERAAAELRPNAPYLHVEALVRRRCAEAGLPMPSRTALIARITHIRRHGHRDHPQRSFQIALDHALVEIAGAEPPAVAVLSAAIVDPPGIVVGWEIGAGEALDRVEARLLARVNRTEAALSARVQLPVGSDADGTLRNALARARVVTVGSPDRERGGELRRVLGPAIGRHRLRQRAPRAARYPVAADAAAIERLRAEVAAVMDQHLGQRVRRLPLVRFVAEHQSPALIAALERISSEEPQPD